MAGFSTIACAAGESDPAGFEGQAMAYGAGGLYPSDECGALGVVVAPSCLDDDLGLGEAVEDLAVEQFVTKLRVEALAVAVLSMASRLDERGLGAGSRNPLPHCLGDELRAVVRTNVTRARRAG
ncbi:hypothetical protein J2S34_003228 [Nitrobacter winogradskyi]|uniref:Uncharacterized protein n=1 Tax=Nitrobacter winogradskyi TaxID=913 RepID=A0ACC6APH8_NITWI|nr:hypothetical protein [Nitrobacter winogradskyi]